MIEFFALLILLILGSFFLVAIMLNPESVKKREKEYWRHYNLGDVPPSKSLPQESLTNEEIRELRRCILNKIDESRKKK